MAIRGELALRIQHLGTSDGDGDFKTERCAVRLDAREIHLRSKQHVWAIPPELQEPKELADDTTWCALDLQGNEISLRSKWHAWVIPPEYQDVVDHDLAVENEEIRLEVL